MAKKQGLRNRGQGTGKGAVYGRLLPRSFFARPSELVAPELLGKLLVHRTKQGTIAGRIVEVEAYLGILDKHLEGRPYILGEAFSLVDCATASFLPLLTRLGVNTVPYANVVKWSGTCMTRPALGRAMQG